MDQTSPGLRCWQNVLQRLSQRTRTRQELIARAAKTNKETPEQKEGEKEREREREMEAEEIGIACYQNRDNDRGQCCLRSLDPRSAWEAFLFFRVKIANIFRVGQVRLGDQGN